MKTITAKYLEEHFEEVIDDVADNKVHYTVVTDQGNLVIVPCDSYDLLHDVYETWVDEPQAPEGFS
jgi:PHD/YefM family antitoxin component YafN of YafNO toxin-antitoxin module